MTILFRELIQNNISELKSYMKWENYELNEKDLPVVEDLKDHALMVLSNSYGNYDVDEDILSELCADIFIYFPTLMQQLAISRLMDAYSVPEDDTISETIMRTENEMSETQQNSQLTLGTSQTETNELDTQQKTTGTVSVEGSTENTQTSNLQIENSSGVEMTGNHTVNLQHNMPEQAISGITGSFPTDPEGTPILSTSTVQNATETFNTSNPIDTLETSEQSSVQSSNTESESVTTNDVTVADTGTTTRTSTNSGSDESQSTTSSDTMNNIEETRTRTETNKQYAYEIKAFLESVDSINAFERWVDKFSWVVGII